MWAQLIITAAKEGKEDGLERAVQELHAAEQPGSGLLRSTTMRDQKDPRRAYTLVLFESEEHARAREADPRRTEGLAKVQAILADSLAGPPEFVDLEVVDDKVF